MWADVRSCERRVSIWGCATISRNVYSQATPVACTHLGLLPPTWQVVVVVNKVDRPAARCDWVVDQTFELFLDLGATDEQCGEGQWGQRGLVHSALRGKRLLAARPSCEAA